MQFGLSIPHTGPGASPEAVRDISQAAEELGYDSLWVGDHVALPRRTASLYDLGARPTPIPEGDFKRRLRPFYDGLTALTYVAGATQRIRLGTAVLVLPLYNPIVNARRLATLDVLSDGRLLVGVGAGWLREEAEALGMPWDHRGARSEEHIAVLRALWTAEAPYVSFAGRFYRFEEIAPEPRPVQRPLPILIGGHSPRARERAGRLGDGWLGATLPPEVQARWVAEIRQVAERHGRDSGRLLFVGYLRLSRSGDGSALSPAELVERIRAYRAAGTGHLIVRFEGDSPAARIAAMRRFAEEVLPESRQPA
jgi:probable F420-dependent oxidoreductase